MPQDIYPSGNDLPDKQASDLYDQAMTISHTDKTTALKKLRQALRLFESCHDTAGAGLAREKIRELGG